MRDKSIYNIIGIISLILIVAPVIIVIITSFNSDNYLSINLDRFSVKWYVHFFTDTQWLNSFLNSLIIASISSLLSVFLGFCSLFIFNKNKIVRLLIFVLFLLPIIIPPLIFGISFLFFFSTLGLVDTYMGIILAHTLLSFPFSYIIINIGYLNMNNNLTTIALSNGATNTFTIFQVILPEIKKNILISYFFSFLVSFDEPVVSLFLSNTNVKTLPRHIFDGLRYDLDPTVSAVSTISIIFSLLIILIVLKRTEKYKDLNKKEQTTI